MNIYLTEQDKKEIEADITEYNSLCERFWEENDIELFQYYDGKRSVSNYILSQAIVLPELKSYSSITEYDMLVSLDTDKHYKNGVIIKPK